MRIVPIALLLITSCFLACSADYETETVEIEPEAPPAPDTTLSAEQEAEAELLDAYFTDLYEDKQFYGNVLIAEEGKVIYRDRFGYANYKSKDTLEYSTRFQLASASKPFTAYGTMLLVQEGKINLDDNVRKYLPSLPYDGITIRMLLSHRSGMNNYMYFADEVWPDRYSNPIHNDDVLRLYAEHQPMYYRLPDQAYEYSNTGYMLLASVIESVSGQSFEDFMQERVFEPIGMDKTTIYRKGSGQELNNVAVGYNGRMRREEDTYLNGVVGDKGVYSTIDDLLKFDQALYAGYPLNLAWQDSAFTPHNKWKKEKDNYGLGWRIKKMDDERHVIYHTGWWKGFRSYFLRDIENERTIIALSHVKRGPFLPVEELVNLPVRLTAEATPTP